MKKLFNRKGMILPFVIIVGAIVIMTGTVLLSTGVLDVKGGNFVERDTQAYFTAKSAAEALAKKMVVGDFSIEDQENYSGTFTGNIGGDGYPYTMTVIKTGDKVEISASSTHKGVTDKATVYLDEITEEDIETLNITAAVYGEQIITGNGTVVIDGDIATATGDVSLGNLTLNGDNLTMVMDYPSPTMDPAPVGLPALTSANITAAAGSYTLSGGILSIGSGKTATINMTGDFSLTGIDNKGTLIINISDGDRKLAVTNITKSGNILIEGQVNGNNAATDPYDNLDLYVDDVFNIDGNINWDITEGGDLDALQPYRLVIWHDIANNSNVTISSNNKFCGYYHLGNVSVTVNGGSYLVGMLVTSSADPNLITYTGGTIDARFLIYAPDADFKMSGSAIINGAIIAKNVDPIIGTAYIQYNEMFNDISIDGVVIEGETSYAIDFWKK